MNDHIKKLPESNIQSISTKLKNRKLPFAFKYLKAYQTRDLNIVSLDLEREKKEMSKVVLPLYNLINLRLVLKVKKN